MVLRYYASAFPMACMLSFFTFCVYRLLLKFTPRGQRLHIHKSKRVLHKLNKDTMFLCQHIWLCWRGNQ